MEWPRLLPGSRDWRVCSAPHVVQQPPEDRRARCRVAPYGAAGLAGDNSTAFPSPYFRVKVAGT